MSDTQHLLPEFDKPPVSEVALSVEFHGLEGWQASHAGLYWHRIIEDFPTTESQLPLISQVEVFGDAFWDRKITYSVEDAPRVRAWFIGRVPTQLIQVQHNRFIVNWRKVKGDEEYPRYASAIRPLFVREWKRFREFVSSRGLGDVEAKQCEVTYVNDIVRGEGWDSATDLKAVFAPWSDKRTDGFLPPVERMAMSGSFLMPEERGRLHFASQNLRRQIDQQEVVQLRLTARGKPLGTTDEDVLGWIDFGHEWVVRGFADLTTPEVHRLWGRKS